MAELLGGMHELLGGEASGDEHDAPAARSAAAGHECTCGEADGPALPELDARTVPHAIRHATIFGAPGRGPPRGRAWCSWRPTTRSRCWPSSSGARPGAFDVDYLDRGRTPGGCG